MGGVSRSPTELYGGALDFEGQLTLSADVTAINTTGYLFAAHTRDGELSLRYLYNAANPKFVLRVRGVDVLETDPNPSQSIGGASVYMARTGDVIRFRAWYRPGGGTRSMGIRVDVNGACGYDVTGTASGAALADATVTIGFHPTLTTAATYPYSSAWAPFTPPGGIAADWPAIGVFIGDSITQPSLTAIGYAPLVLTAANIVADKRVFTLARSGALIANQLTAWQACVHRGKSYLRFVFIQCGTNDLITRSAAQIRTDLQALVDDINTSTPDAVIVMNALPPCKGYAPLADAGQQTKWAAVNTSIAGGASPITGVDDRISANPTFDDGSGFLKPAYDYGDGLHINNAAGVVVSQLLVRPALQARGII